KEFTVEALSYSTHQHGHVGTLPPTVGMQFIQDEKTQTLRILSNRFICCREACQYELQHYVVCQQDVGRVLGNPFSFLFLFLAGIASKCNWFVSFSVPEPEVLFQFLALAVGQRV